MDREKEILKVYKNEGIDGLKRLNATNDEIDKIVNRIDDKIKQLNIEALNIISKQLNYTFPSDYCDYYSSQISLHIKPNLLKINNIEKMIRHLFSMDENSKTYIMKFQKFDSNYEKQLVPFAELEFGDLLCFDRNTNDIIYYNHEQDTISKVADNWQQLKDMLYE